MTFIPRQQVAECGCDASSASSGLISMDTALSRIRSALDPVEGTERVAVADAKGRVLAEDLLAPGDLPGFDRAAMDGYAVASADLRGGGPWTLPILARVAAGDTAEESSLASGAVRIFTGAPIPTAFDAVVMQEQVHVDEHDTSVRLMRRPESGENIRRRGEEHRRGAVILPAGSEMTPRAIASAAAAGRAIVTVRRRFSVSIVATGSELFPAGQACVPPGRVPDSNTPMLQAALSRSGVGPISITQVGDDPKVIRRALQDAAAKSDLVITSGGLSVGEADHVRPAIEAIGGRTVFAGVAIKPGKPVAFGRIGHAAWLGLPGNPGAAYVTWTLFGETIVAAITGAASTAPARRYVVLASSLSRKPGRCEIRPARLVGVDGHGRDIVDGSRDVRSSQTTELALSDGLILVPADADHLPEGALIDYLPFQNL